MGKGNMDKNGPYNTKSFRNNRPVAPFFSGNSAIFMPTTTVSYSPILQAHHTTTQSNVTPFVEAIPPQAGLSPKGGCNGNGMGMWHMVGGGENFF